MIVYNGGKNSPVTNAVWKIRLYRVMFRKHKRRMRDYSNNSITEYTKIEHRAYYDMLDEWITLNDKPQKDVKKFIENVIKEYSKETDLSYNVNIILCNNKIYPNRIRYYLQKRVVFIDGKIKMTNIGLVEAHLCRKEENEIEDIAYYNWRY